MPVRKLAMVILLAGTLGFGGDRLVRASRQPILWRDPGAIASRNVFYGPGGRDHQPRPPFRFVKEDLDGTNPKFVVRDRDGVRWKVKLGAEARPETAAARLVWAAGYFADEDYFLPKLRVSGMPRRLHRGQNFISPDGSIRYALLKRQPPGQKKTGIWRWDQNPFAGSRELNGLKTLMALLNNWDLKAENNAIREEGPDLVYLVSDLGATFGRAGIPGPHLAEKGTLPAYENSGFIRKVHAATVDFRSPAFPGPIFVFDPPVFISRIRLERVGRGIPRNDARWLGRILAGLSQRQIEDAFRAAGYFPHEVEGYSKIIGERIAELSDL